MMIGALLPILIVQAADSGGTTAIPLSGRCEYSEAVARFRRETTLILCDSLAIERGDQGTMFDFSRRSWGTTLRVSGEISGAHMTVHRVRFRSGATVAASGSCEIFYSGGKMSTVTCLAKAGSRSYAANFVQSRL